MEEDGTLSKARKPDSTDEAHLQPDAATTRADSKHGFEDFDLAPRKEQLASDVGPSLKHAIVQLNDGDTAMRLYDFEPHKFSQAGNCVLWCCCALERAVEGSR